MAFGIEAASLYAAVGVDVGRAVTDLSRVGSEFDRVTAAAQRTEQQARDFGVEAEAWADDFGKVSAEAAEVSVNLDRMARRREMPLAEADRLRETLDRLGAEADQAGAEMAELARQGKSIDPARSAELARQINRVEGELREATAQADKFDREMRSAADNSGRFNGVISKMGPLLGALGFAGITYGIVNMVRSMVGGAAEMEKFRVQFEVLLGSAEAADARIRELAEFVKTTPFELPEVVRASRTLEVFTKGALAAGDGLRLVGDVAAGTGMPFEDVAMWVGRMYDALQSGRPFGEATMRLQEMGAIGGESRQKIEELAAGVKSGAMTMEEAWAGVAGEFSRFDGMMERQAETLGGAWSNLQDAIGMGLTRMGEGLMPIIKELIPALISGFESVLGAGQPVMAFIGDRLIWAFENLDAIVTYFTATTIVKLISGLSAAEVKAKALAVGVRAVAAAFVLFLPEITDGVAAVQRWVQETARGEEYTNKFASALERLGGDDLAANVWVDKVEGMGVSLERFAQAVEAAGGDVGQALRDIEAGVDPVAETWERNMSEATRAAAAFARNTADVIQEDLVDEIDRQLMDIEDKFGNFVKSVEQTPEGVAAVLADGTTVVGESAEELAGLIDAAFRAAEEASVQAMMDMMGRIADVLSKDEIVKIVEEHAEKSANAWSDYGRRGYIEAVLSSEQIRDGLRSKDTDVVQDTITLVDQLLAQYDAMAPGAIVRGELVNPALLEGIRNNLGITEDELQEIADALGLKLDFSEAAEGYGADNIAAYADGIEGATEDAAQAASAAAARAKDPLERIDGYQSGFNLSYTFAQGMKDAIWWITDAANKVAGAAARGIAINSEPEDTSSPLYGITKWGGNLVRTYAEGIWAHLDEMYAAAQALAGAANPAFATPEMAFAGTAPGQAGQSFAGTAATAQEVHYHGPYLTVEGDLKARNTAEVEDSLLRVSRFGAGAAGELAPA